jgi:hypothetical protein
VADLLGLQSGEPTALLLVEAGDQEVETPMDLSVAVVRWPRDAVRALALMNVHRSASLPKPGRGGPVLLYREAAEYL